MILSREQIDAIAQHHRHDVDLGRWNADELDLIETARAYHDAIDERDAARAEHVVLYADDDALQWLCGWNYPCATVRLLEGDSDD